MLLNGKVESVIVNMGKPNFNAKEIPALENRFNLKVLEKNFEAFCVSVGNPHCVVFVDDLENFDVGKYGKIIENDEHFPDRVNVEFIEIINKYNIKMRVWERGSGETLACGTGAVAVSAVCHKYGYTNRNVNVWLKGGVLKINWNQNDNNIYMEGFANKVFEGKIEFELS